MTPSPPPPVDRLRIVRRVGFGLLAAVNLVGGGWAVASPRAFFRQFPGFGMQWTQTYPPYNGHLVVDLGATMLTLAVLFAGAAILDRPAVSGLVAAATSTFGTLHFGFHALDAGTMQAGDRALSLLSLVAGALLPPALAATHLWSRR